jgi:ribosome-associated protein
MQKTAKRQGPVKLKEAVIRGIADKKGKNIVCLNMSKVSGTICDYFVICEGDSSVQVDTIARSIEEEVLKTTGENVYHSEGFENSEWVLLDYVDVIVHIFQPHIRSFYNLEALWDDAEHEEIIIEQAYKHAQTK